MLLMRVIKCYRIFCSSHMDFEPEWDQNMVDMWDLTENEYAVLSTYVANIGQLFFSQ